MGEREYLKAEWGGRPRTSFWATDPGTKALLIGLAAIHLLMAFLGRLAPGVRDGIADLLWLHPELVLKKLHVWQLLTYSLFHAPGLGHLLGNALGIWFLGRMVEQRIGLRRYLVFCVAAAVTGSLLYLLQAVLLRQTNPMLGASAFAIALVVLAALWYPRVTILLFFVLPMPLWVAAAILVGVDLLMLLQMAGGVAHVAHLGGALYALVYWKYGGGVERVFKAIDTYADRRRLERDQRERAREAELRKEIDRILDKVNREGMNALSDEEKRFLKNASEKLRR